ncbi:hypothetical protein KL86SPO_20206 [uncultured Sporomusa sp.]|uniref:Uncharacterized protein n=1 Tax=uncultured Sporomusa sp. TaxID=307249 RepID=A0A212LMH0_9FIRM|nr:hypothetical protein [uncultured Sporomusa sp.]SCM78722.1 hypothetical protein KL86SPO_20206 [uncultured Sporomusa sp.]
MSTKIAVALSDPGYSAPSQIGTSEYNGTSFTNYADVVTRTSPDPDLTNDVKVFWFKNKAGAERILVAETRYDPITYAPNPSLISVYDGTGSSWGSALFGPVELSFDGTTPTAANSIINLYGIVEKTVGTDHYLYGIDYDQKTVFRLINSSADNYAMDTASANQFVPPAGDRGVQTFGQDIVVVEETNSSTSLIETFVCALFLDGTNIYGGNYNSSLLYKLDTDLTQVGAVGHVGKNATGIKFRTVTTTGTHTTLYIPSIGGMQNFGSGPSNLIWNIDSKLQTVPVANITSVTDRLAVAAGGTGSDPDGFDIRDIAIDNSGNALVLVGCYYNDMSSPLFSYMTGKLYSLPVSTIDTASNSLLDAGLGADNITFGPLDGWVWALAYDRLEDLTWFGQGNEFNIYDNPGSAPPSVIAGPVDSASLGNFPSQRGNVNSFTVYGHVRLRSAHPSPAFHSNSSMALKARPQFIEQLKQTAATK